MISNKLDAVWNMYIICLVSLTGNRKESLDTDGLNRGGERGANTDRARVKSLLSIRVLYGRDSISISNATYRYGVLCDLSQRKTLSIEAKRR